MSKQVRLAPRKSTQNSSHLQPIILPPALRDRYRITASCLWKWERAGKLPKRDVFIGGRAEGWRVETIEAAERNASAAA